MPWRRSRANRWPGTRARNVDHSSGSSRGKHSRHYVGKNQILRPASIESGAAHEHAHLCPMMHTVQHGLCKQFALRSLQRPESLLLPKLAFARASQERGDLVDRFVMPAQEIVRRLALIRSPGWECLGGLPLV